MNQLTHMDVMESREKLDPVPHDLSGRKVPSLKQSLERSAPIEGHRQVDVLIVLARVFDLHNVPVPCIIQVPSFVEVRRRQLALENAFDRELRGELPVLSKKHLRVEALAPPDLGAQIELKTRRG